MRHATLRGRGCRSSEGIPPDDQPDRRPERDNIRSGLTNAIEEGDVEQAVRSWPTIPTAIAQTPARGQCVGPRLASSRLTRCRKHPDYPRVMMVAAYEALDSGDTDRADALCHQALEVANELPTPLEGPPLEIDALALRAEDFVAAGAYADAVRAYTRAAELAAVGYPGIAAIFFAYSVSSALLGGGDLNEATARAEARDQFGPTIRGSRRDRDRPQFAGAHARRPRS